MFVVDGIWVTERVGDLGGNVIFSSGSGNNDKPGSLRNSAHLRDLPRTFYLPSPILCPLSPEMVTPAPEGSPHQLPSTPSTPPSPGFYLPFFLYSNITSSVTLC